MSEICAAPCVQIRDRQKDRVAPFPIFLQMAPTGMLREGRRTARCFATHRVLRKGQFDAGESALLSAFWEEIGMGNAGGKRWTGINTYKKVR